MMRACGTTAGKAATMLLFDENKHFYKGNLHTHTSFSDRHASAEEAMALYQAHGYDFLAITDHRTVSVPLQWHKNMLVLPGIELDITLPNQAIHLVGIGVDAALGALPRADTPQQGIDNILRHGGIAILAHPLWSLNTTDTLCSLQHLTAVEIYNSTSRAPWHLDRADATPLLDIAAANGCLHNTVASDDTHQYTGDQCMSYTMVQADTLTQEGILHALRRGAFYASQGPRFEQVSFDGTTVRVQCSPVHRVLFHTNLPYAPARCVEGEGLTTAEYRVQRGWGERFVRVILQDDTGLRAWANPFSIE